MQCIDQLMRKFGINRQQAIDIMSQVTEQRNKLEAKIRTLAILKRSFSRLSMIYLKENMLKPWRRKGPYSFLLPDAWKYSSWQQKALEQFEK